MRPQLPFTLLALFLSSCDLTEPCSGSDCSGQEEPVCTASYQGPTSGSVAGTCELIFEQRCQNGNEYGADENCRYALSAEDAARCPYCPPRESNDPGSGGGSDTSCNSSGIAFGCPDAAPYSCPASDSCFESYGACVSTSPCTY